MANVTISIEGDIEEVVATIARMAGSDGAASRPEPPPMASVEEPAVPEIENDPPMPALSPAPAPAPEPPAEPTASWNISYVNSFWRTLSDTARQAMLRVSRSPNHTQRRTQLMHTLNKSQRELSGSLSSQGHSLNRLRKRRNVDLPRPLTYSREEDVYILDADFASAMREMGLT